MNTAKLETYDRLAVGERLRLKRTLIGLTQEEIAEKIGRAPKYYADIERGTCGMSVETMMALARTMNMSLDFLLYGKSSVEASFAHADETGAIINMLDNCSERNRKYCVEMLKLFLAACGE